MGGGGGALISDLTKPSRPDFLNLLFLYNLFLYHFVLTSLIQGSDGDNETAE